MKLCVLGAGYVGLVAGAGFADFGNEVACCDVDGGKIANLQAGQIPIYEPGLDALVRDNAKDHRLTFTTDVRSAVAGAEVVFIAVGTPPGEDGEADLRYVEAAAESIGRSISGFTVVVNKSTVPVGTAEWVRGLVARHTRQPFAVVSNPEFLKEGAAIEDFMRPDRVVLGIGDAEVDRRAADVMRRLYAPIVRTNDRLMVMDQRSAELTKYAANAMLATRISCMNEIANLCERLGTDVDLVRRGIGADPRIGASFLFPGIGYGGSCLMGRESVLVRRGGVAQLMRLDDLWIAHTGETLPVFLEVLSWRFGAQAPEYLPVSAVTRRPYEGEMVEVRTKMGRRVRCTTDHPFVTRSIDQVEDRVSVKLAGDLETTDWLPIAIGVASAAAAPAVLDMLEGMRPALLRPEVEHLGLGSNSYTVGLPDLIWDRPENEKRALLTGLWLGDGSWSYCNGGASVVLQYGTVSRALADGILRLLGELRIVASLRVARTDKSTRDTYWLTIAGADQVERALWLAKPRDHEEIRAALARQTKRTAPTGHRPIDANASWVRVASTKRTPYVGDVYSLEVPGAETFVTTGGLVTHNCFPKDVLALLSTAKKHGGWMEILEAVHRVNERQKVQLFAKILKHFGGHVEGRRIAIWGLAFKPGTDDIRQAPALTLMEWLLASGAELAIYDPVAMPAVQEELRAHDRRARVQAFEDPYDALVGAHALALCTEWHEFRLPAFARMKERLVEPTLFDGRNVWDPAEVRDLGFTYYGIGRR